MDSKNDWQLYLFQHHPNDISEFGIRQKKLKLDRCPNPCKHVHNLTASCSLVQKVTVPCLWSFTISNYKWNLSVHSMWPTLPYAFANFRDVYNVWGTWCVRRDCRCMAACVRVHVNACIYVRLSKDNDVVGVIMYIPHRPAWARVATSLPIAPSLHRACGSDTPSWPFFCLSDFHWNSTWAVGNRFARFNRA